VGVALDSSIDVLPELAGAVADDGSVDLGPGELVVELAAFGARSRCGSSRRARTSRRTRTARSWAWSAAASARTT